MDWKVYSQDLSYKRLRRAGNGKLVSMGCYYFPNWGKAIEGVGLDYSKIKKMHGPPKKCYNRAYRLLKGVKNFDCRATEGANFREKR